MRHIPGIDRSQVLLLPEAVDDYVGRDNPVRFIDAFVDGLDLVAAGFERAAPKATGRPGYDPADLLKLYIYGYLNRVRSSRRLEAESKRNLEVIWLLRRLSPDFKTIADFRRINRAAFRQVFREFVRLCRELELFGRELVAVDGTRIKAVNSRKRNFTKAKLEKALAESDERLSRYLDRLDEADGQDEGGTGGGEVEHIQEKIAAIQGRRERFEEHRDALAASGEGQLSLTDPDSRAMYAETRVGVGYNIQIAVDAKHKLIAEQQVHNKVSDLGLLAETAVAARRNLAVDRIDAVADAGYFKIEDIEACENAGVMPHVPKPQRGSTVSQGLFPKERFRYDGGEDIYICPNGQRLALHSKRKRRDLFFASYANRAACKECQLKSKCTKSAFRRLWCMEPRWCDRPFPGWLADPDCVWFRRTDRAIEYVDLHGDFGLLGLECASVELAAVEPLDASHGCFAKRSQSVALSFLPVHPSLRRDLRRMVLPFRSAMRRVRGRNGCGAWRDDDFRW